MIVSILGLFVFTAFSIHAFNKGKAEKQYAKETTVLKNKINETEQTLLNLVHSKERPVADLIKEFRGTYKNQNFEKELADLNANPVFELVVAKESAGSLGIDRFIRQMGTIDSEMEMLGEVTSECFELDKSFEKLMENKDCGYSEALNEVTKLKTENKRIHEKLSEIKVSEATRQFYSRMDKALQFREKSIDFYYRALLSDFESVITVAACNEVMEEASGFIVNAKLSQAELINYTKKAREATNTAKERQSMLVKSLEAAETYYLGSSDMLEKYKSTLGL